MSTEIHTCPECGQKSKITFDWISTPGAGSGADWEYPKLSCKHYSNDPYDSNRFRVYKVDPVEENEDL